MENIIFELNDDTKDIDLSGFPNAQKVISLTGVNAQKITDLMLHKSDLEFAEKCLKIVNDNSRDDFERGTFWRMAVIYFIRCFTKNDARVSTLSIKDVIGSDLEGQKVFEVFRHLRNKNVAHDENSINRCIPGAVINKLGQPHIIERVITISFYGETFCEENVSNLSLLIKEANRYIETKYDSVCEKITEELESVEYNELISRDRLSYQKFDYKDIDKNRLKH